MELLKYFPFTLLLFGFIVSFRLDCEFDLVSPIVNSQRSKKEPSCSVKEFKVLENDTAVTEVQGNYLPEIKTNDDVKIFYIAVGVNTEHVPTKVCSFFKNLELFVLSGHSIKRISQEVFINCKKVWRVRISFTSLTNLPKDLFVDLIELDELYIFNNNKLVSLPADLLEKNTKLRELHLIDNPLSTIDAELPSSLTSIAISAAFGVCIDKIFPRDVSDLNLFLEEVASKCESPTKKSYRLKANDLYKTLSEKEEEISELKSSCGSCDGNLNAATNLLMSSKALQTCSSIDVISRFSEHEKVVLLCESFDESSCVAIDLKVQFDNTRIDKFSDAMRAPSKLKTLTILKQQTLFLPANLDEMFSNLKDLNVTYSGLFSIDNSCLSGLTNLQTLILRGNKIHEIPLKAFMEVRTLKNLDLSENKIEKVKAETFRSLTSLKILNLSGNKLKLFSSNFFNTLKSIEKADLTNNDCIDISFPEATKEIIEKTIIAKCVLPVKLNCGEDTKQNQEHDDFVSYKDSDISSLKIVDQSMNFVPPKLSKMFPNLQIIVIKNSGLLSLRRNDFPGLNRLKKIEITGNNLISIEKGTFDEVTELEVLDLSSNEIKSFPSRIFIHLENLKKLILSSNRLKQFTADLLPFKCLIVEFRINSNQLQMIEANTLRFLKNSKVIDFSNNICIDTEYEKYNVYGISFADLSGHIKSLCLFTCDIFNCS